MAILSVGAMWWLSHTALELAREEIEADVNDDGIVLVSTLSAQVRPSSITDPTRHPELRQKLERFRSERRSSRIEDILVFDRSGQAIALLESTSLTQGERVDYAQADELGIEIASRTANKVPVRSFSKKLPAAPDAEIPGPIGSVVVLVSTQRIADARERVSQSLTQLTLISGFAVAALAFLVATFLTRSIRWLREDVRIVSLGRLDHESEISSSDELGDLARAFNHMTHSLLQAQDTKLRERALDQELSLATQIQESLLPENVPKIAGLDIAVHYESAKEVGGDYFDFIKVDRQRLGVVVADVSGKGVPASLVMTMTRSLLRMAATDQLSPDATVTCVNRLLSPDLQAGMFVTLAYLVLDAKTKEIRLVRAGHNAPLFFRSENKRLHQLTPEGLAIGLDRGGDVFDARLQSQRLRMETGDVLVLYSDGIVEGKNEHDEDFGDDALRELVASTSHLSAQEMVDEVIAALDDHRGPAEPSDDVTLLVLKAR
ncbi:MAG: PP2C family protein-serine/threonine phosphatase [Planctomycetota bacterium]